MRRLGLALALCLLTVPPALAQDGAFEQSAATSMHLGGTAVAYDGEVVWLLGGDVRPAAFLVESGYISIYDPRDDTLRTLDTYLPSPRTGSVAFAAGDSIYVLGGRVVPQGGRYPQDSTEIVRLDRATGAAVVLDATLPQPIHSGGVAVVDGVAYLVGGLPGGDRSIMAFDPATETAALMDTTLPGTWSHVQAVSRAGLVAIAGGFDGAVHPRDDLLLYDPESGETILQEDVLPYGTGGAGAVALGPGILLFGGTSNTAIPGVPGSSSGPVPAISLVDPKTGDAAILADRMPRPGSDLEAVPVGDHVYLFGFDDGSILRYDVRQAELEAVLVRGGTGQGGDAGEDAGAEGGDAAGRPSPVPLPLLLAALAGAALASRPRRGLRPTA